MTRNFVPDIFENVYGNTTTNVTLIELSFVILQIYIPLFTSVLFGTIFKYQNLLNYSLLDLITKKDWQSAETLLYKLVNYVLLPFYTNIYIIN